MFSVAVQLYCIIALLYRAALYYSSTIFSSLDSSYCTGLCTKCQTFITYLVRLLLDVGGHLGGGPEVLVQLFDGHLVVEPDRGVLDHLDGLHDIVGGLGGLGELGDSAAEGLGRLLVLLLHQHDPLGEGGHVALHLVEHLLGLFQGLGGLGQLVVGLVVANLKLLDFLAIIMDVAVSLICPARPPWSAPRSRR